MIGDSAGTSSLADADDPNPPRDLLEKAELHGTRILRLQVGNCDLSDMERLTRYSVLEPESCLSTALEA